MKSTKFIGVIVLSILLTVFLTACGGGEGGGEIPPTTPPTVTSVIPSSGTQGQILDVTIAGTNFTGATSVSFGEGITVNSFTVNSSTQIVSNIAINSSATPGTRNVSVTTPTGTGTGKDFFIVQGNIAGAVVYHPPTSEIKYSYYQYVPESALKRNPVRVLLYGHGSSSFITYSQIEEEVRTIEIPRIKPYCDTYGYAFIIVVTPRNFGPYPDYKMNTQSMARWVMFSNEFDKPEYEFYKRPDLVFNKVIDDFMNFLRSNGYTPYPKVFMTGFSNGGMQSNRFPILHSSRVAATAIGAAGAFLYPVETWNGIPLTYPVGTWDISQIPGNTYSLSTFKQIPHFIFVGENDLNYNNDPVNFNDNYDLDQATIINAYFGSNPVIRPQTFSNYLNSIGMQSTAKVYPGVGHNYTSQMLVETFNFFDSVSTQ